MISFVAPSAHARLPHKNEAAQKDRFEGEKGTEKRIRRWIEVPEARNRQGVRHDPSGKYKQMKDDEAQTAYVPGYRVAQPFRRSSFCKELLLVLCDQINVFLNMFLRHRGLFFWCTKCLVGNRNTPVDSLMR